MIGQGSIEKNIMFSTLFIVKIGLLVYRYRFNSELSGLDRSNRKYGISVWAEIHINVEFIK